MKRVLLALTLAALLAGCATTPSATTTTPTPADAEGALAPSSTTEGPNATAATRAMLHFTPDGGLADAAPTTESTVPLTTPANSPMTADYPDWSGATTRELPARGNVTFRLFVTSSSASVAANTIPVFSDLPGIGMTLTLGSVTVTGSAPSPTVIRAGEVIELVVTVPYEAKAPIPSGSAVSYVAEVYYSHVIAAAEFQYVLGGSHATRVEVA